MLARRQPGDKSPGYYHGVPSGRMAVNDSGARDSLVRHRGRCASRQRFGRTWFTELAISAISGVPTGLGDLGSSRPGDKSPGYYHGVPSGRIVFSGSLNTFGSAKKTQSSPNRDHWRSSPNPPKESAEIRLIGVIRVDPRETISPNDQRPTTNDRLTCSLARRKLSLKLWPGAMDAEPPATSIAGLGMQQLSLPSSSSQARR